MFTGWVVADYLDANNGVFFVVTHACVSRLCMSGLTVRLSPAVAVLYPSGEHGQWGGSAEREALEDLQPVRNSGDSPRTRGCWQGWYNTHKYTSQEHNMVSFFKRTMLDKDHISNCDPVLGSHRFVSPCHIILYLSFCPRSLYCRKNSQPSSTAAMCLYRPRVVICGEFPFT